MARLLLVEDDAEIRRALIRALTERGHTVSSTPSGLSALQLVLDDRPDLVVLDLGLPDVDGHQVLDTMKSDPVLSSIPVVVLSAVARERPVGAAAFLRKPIPLQKFFDTIKGFVEAGLPRPGLAQS